MSLAAKISAGFLILLALLAGASWYQLTLIDRLHAENRVLSQTHLEASSLGLGLKARLARLRELGHKLLVLRDAGAGYAAELQRARQQFAADLDRLRGLDLEAGELDALHQLESAWDEWAIGADARESRFLEQAADERGDLSVEGPNVGDLNVEYLRAELDRRLDAVAAEIDLLRQASREAIENKVATSAGRVERARRIAWAATLAGLGLAALIAAGLVRSLIRPLRQLGRGTRELAEGHLDYRVPVEGGPELEALAEDFNAMTRRLGELDGLKKDFVANVSHDLKAPLASIQEATGILLEEIPGPLTKRQRRLLELNLESGGRLTRMIGDLLDLSRLETGAVDYDLEPHDLKTLSRTAAKSVAALASDKRLRLKQDFPTGPAVVDCDGPAIVKVVQNLLSNAVKYAPAGSAVGLRIRTPGDAGDPAAEIEVWDAGPGIPDEHKAKIFERFHRVDPDSGPPGTGLGLAIVREIVAGHEGDLRVADRPGGGSVFTVSLPRRRQPTARLRVDASVAALLLLAAGLPLLGGCRTAEPPVQIQATRLEIGDEHFSRGDFSAAAAAYETWLAGGPSPQSEDRVLFRLGLMYTLPGSPVSSPARGSQLFAELVERFPASPFRSATEYLLGLQGEVLGLQSKILGLEDQVDGLKGEIGGLESEVERLRKQLEEIKRIDLDGGG